MSQSSAPWAALSCTRNVSDADMGRAQARLNGAPTYELEAATRTYGEGPTLITALDALDLTIGSGEFVAILGPSGSGKTTLLQLLGALDGPTAGTVRFEGRQLEGLGEGELADLRLSALGFVFQQFNLIP